MTTSRKLTSALLALFALAMMSVSALAADPGLNYPPESEVSDQKAGSLLFYNHYTSAATLNGANTQNTRINITNTSSTSAAFVHLFFVAENCSVADSYICLTANQTASFLAHDVDPSINGYLVAVAVDGVLGCPVAFNHLIGDEYIKNGDFAANLGAEAFSALFYDSLPGCDGNSSAAFLGFTGAFGGYNRAPRVLALSNIPSRVDGNDTVLIVNRVSGNLATGAASIGSLFGLLYDDAENVISFNIPNLNCQARVTLSNSLRTTPRIETYIPTGRTGWMKIWNGAGDVPILGAMINAHDDATASPGAFNGGHNLHKLTLSTTGGFTIPIFPPSC